MRKAGRFQCRICRLELVSDVLLPRHLELSSVVSAVSQVKVDQGLIRDSFGFGQGLEVVDGAAIDVDGDLLLQAVCVGVFSGI